MDFDLIATTTFGIEGITAKELRALGLMMLRLIQVRCILKEMRWILLLLIFI